MLLSRNEEGVTRTLTREETLWVFMIQSIMLQLQSAEMTVRLRMSDGSTNETRNLHVEIDILDLHPLKPPSD